MTELLSDKTKTVTVEGDFSVEIPESTIKEKDGQYQIPYVRVITKEDVYRISIPEFDAKKKAISVGAKFLQLGDDLVNINEIKKFSRKIAYKKQI